MLLSRMILMDRRRLAIRHFTSFSRHGDESVTHQEKSSLLFLSSASWPEPNATAAGIRTTSLLELFSSSNLFTSVHFGCGATVPSSLFCANGSNEKDVQSVHWHQIKLNRQSEMKTLLHNIQDRHGPIKAVVFDRFYSEEAFSFTIKEVCPDALRILDMQDVHSLRIGRQSLVEEIDKGTREAQTTCNDLKLSSQLMDKVMAFDPRENHHEIGDALLPSKKRNITIINRSKEKSYDTFLRELASIHRSDLVFVCSPKEMELLRSWNVPTSKMTLASFFCTSTLSPIDVPSFHERHDFVTVGGFKHHPNVDSVKVLRHEIWPRIRNKLPNNDVRLHIYGAYPTQEILSLNDDESGFLVHGRIEDLDSELRTCRVLLAPLRFGAGIKGKIVDGWRCGCPVVTTPIGSEGMLDEDYEKDSEHTHNVYGRWGGAVVRDTDAFVDAAVELYTRRSMWNKAQLMGNDLLRKLFNMENNFHLVQAAVRDAMAELKQRRMSDTVGVILWHQNMRCTKYFSKWLELKETMKSGAKSDQV